MSNKNTLVPQAHKLTVDELSKGGKKSVYSRRKKRFLREQLEQLMLLDLNECKLKDNMRKLGIEENNLSIQNGICVALVQQALNGSIRAFKVIGEYLQQDPKFGENKEHIENIFFINDIPNKLKERENGIEKR